MDDIYIARQPVYDRDLKIIGYELLYRDSEINSAVFDDSNRASSDTIVNSFIHIGIDNLVGTSLAFVNLPAEFILNSDLVPMFHEQSVLEILEDVEPTDDILSGIKKLKAKGYKIALDDFIYSEKMNPLLALTDYVKIDVLEYQPDELAALVTQLRNDYKLELIAEKVESQLMFQQCKQLEFDYYQGYFFCYPQIVTQKNIAPNKMVVLNLISQLQNPETEYDELEIILTQDVTLSYKLLRYLNSAAFSLRREIDTIKDAIVLLGLDAVKNWACLLLMSKVIDQKPDQLITTALVRAKMAELLAHQSHPEIEKQAFVCGLFSVIDALMDKPMVDLLDTVILSSSVKMALLDHEGELGIILNNCILYERARFSELHDDHVNTENYYEYYLSAVKWADQTMKLLQD